MQLSVLGAGAEEEMVGEQEALADELLRLVVGVAGRLVRLQVFGLVQVVRVVAEQLLEVHLFLFVVIEDLVDAVARGERAEPGAAL